MVLYDNTHNPSLHDRQRVRDLAIAGIPKYLIADILEIDIETLNKHYQKQLTCSEPEAVERVAKTVVMQALDGNEKSQSLYLKTKGAKYGWVEKQVIESIGGDDTQALKEKIKELEEKYKREY